MTWFLFSLAISLQYNIAFLLFLVTELHKVLNL